MNQIEHLRALMKVADPKSWRKCYNHRPPSHLCQGITSPGRDITAALAIADAELIVAAINALPQLLAVMEAACKLQIRAAQRGPFDDIGVELNILDNALSDFRADPKATGIDGQGVGDASVILP